MAYFKEFFAKYIAFFAKICYNIEWVFFAFLLPTFYLFKGVFMWNEKKADRTEKYLQSV